MFFQRDLRLICVLGNHIWVWSADKTGHKRLIASVWGLDKWGSILMGLLRAYFGFSLVIKSCGKFSKETRLKDVFCGPRYRALKKCFRLIFFTTSIIFNGICQFINRQ